SDKPATRETSASLSQAPPPAAPTAAPQAPAPPPMISVNFAASANQVFDGVTAIRMCSDSAADMNQATLVDAQYLYVVRAARPSEVLTTIQGADLERIKICVLTTGKFEFAVDPSRLPRQGEDYEYAIIAGGDSRFGSPSA